MKVRREAAGRRDPVDDLGRAVHRLERADAKQNVRLTAGRDRHATRRQGVPEGPPTMTAAARSRPYDPRWTPVSAISLKPAAVTRATSASTSSNRHASAAGRASSGMMQYEHCSAQPVCTRSVKAVRPATPGSSVAPQLPSPSPKRSAVVKVDGS